MDIYNFIQTGIFLAAIVAIVFTQINIKRQNQLQMFAEYTRRYQEIILNMPDDIYSGEARVDERTKRYMSLYFDLCSEEYHLWKEGGIPDNVWNIWLEGMQIACKQRIYKNSWDAIKGVYNDEFWRYFEKNVINKHAS